MTFERRARVEDRESLHRFYRDVYVPFYTEVWPSIVLGRHCKTTVWSEHVKGRGTE